jgi:nicotinamidase-related amidase
MNPETLSPHQTALLLVDMQNDFFFKKGAYPRAGIYVPDAAGLVKRLAEMTELVREGGGYIVSTHFTLLPGRGGEPLVPPAIRQARPFLAKDDFAPGTFGHRLIEELAPADVQVDKIMPSAFYGTFLDFALRQLGIDTLIIGGITTNSGVAATLRDAQAHGYRTILLTDGCAAFAEDAHEATVASLRHIAPQASCEQMTEILEGYK